MTRPMTPPINQIGAWPMETPGRQRGARSVILAALWDRKTARVAGMQKLAAPWGATAPERRLGGGTRRIIQQSGRQEGRWDGDTPPA